MFHEAESFLRFAMAGRAVFTARSPATGCRFTYRVRRAKDTLDAVRFVDVLTGPDNDGGDYTFIGTIFQTGDFRPSSKSRIGPDARSVHAFEWIWRKARDGQIRAEIFHEGKCGRCGRTLTVPESIESGIGPECAKKG